MAPSRIAHIGGASAADAFDVQTVSDGLRRRVKTWPNWPHLCAEPWPQTVQF